MGDWQPLSNQPPADREFIAAYFEEGRGEWIYDFARWHLDHVCGINDGSGPWTHWIDLQPPEPHHTKGD